MSMIAPPIFRPSAPSRRILPFGLAWKPERLLCSLREPLYKLLRIVPAQICDRAIILAGRCIGTSLCRDTRVPLTNSDWEFADRKGLDRDVVDRLFGKIVVTS